jgi:hypothetical protein
LNAKKGYTGIHPIDKNTVWAIEYDDGSLDVRSTLDAPNGDGFVDFAKKYVSSDRRLKNVGEKYTAGLSELKKLDFYNFTFKKDKKKTPQVGVMAQDLQKVFPTAVFEGPDPEKYLRIRWDEMFYAVINAVKELDAKITEIVANVKANTDKIANMQATIDNQQKVIMQQEKAIADLTKRLEKLEKKSNK